MKTNIYLFTACIGLILLTSFTYPKENEKTEQFIKDYFESFNRHDWKGLSSFYHEKALFKSPVLGDGVHLRTREDIVQEYTELSQLIPDVKDSVVTVHTAGKQHIIVEFISTGTDPSGEVFALPICTIFKVEDGLITEDFTYYDNF